MRKFAIPAIAAMFAFNAGAALAWSDVSGTIKSIDMKAHQFVLDNGKTYAADGSVNLATFRTGDKVTVSTEMQNGKNMVNKVTRG